MPTRSLTASRRLPSESETIATIRAPGPLGIFALVLIVGGFFALSGRNDERADDVLACRSTPEGCPTVGADEISAPPTYPAEEFCYDVGYLCAGLEESESVRLYRWSNFDGTVVVHVPIPENVDPSVARDLQREAARGIRAWNNEPFPILVDLQGDRNPHFAVRWSGSLVGNQLGVARTRWSAATGLLVESIELGTRNLRSPGGSPDPRQIRLTAAHEMGHALGLPHSDSSRDVMYPQNTATSMSSRDYRSIEVLYQTPDGTTITR